MNTITYKQIEELKTLPYLPDRVLKIDIDQSGVRVIARVSRRSVINTTAGIVEGAVTFREYWVEEDK
jgi:hypothetical protein